MDDTIRHPGDFHLCHDCLEGIESSIALLRERVASPAIGFLVAAGASGDEAANLVDSLWADLLSRGASGVPRIARYDGSCSFQTWFNSVALNKLLTRKRQQRRWQDLIPGRIGTNPDGSDALGAGSMADPEADEPETALLVELMREAIEHAFQSCGPEDFVLLQLKHCDGLRGTELATMFGCDASVISRRLEKAQAQIAASTLWKIRQADPWLELKWPDFVELCRTATPACFGLG